MSVSVGKKEFFAGFRPIFVFWMLRRMPTWKEVAVSNAIVGRVLSSASALARSTNSSLALLILSATIVSILAASSSAAVTVWEDQFTAPSAGWNVPVGTSFTYQASAAPNSEDGFEVVYTSTTSGAQYATYTLPFTNLLPGDKIEWGVRTYWPYTAGATGDRVLLENAVYDSGFAIHDSGNSFTKLSVPVSGTLQLTNNLWLGTNSGAFGQADSVMYLDYVRITREVVPEPGCLMLASLAIGMIGAARRRERNR